MWKIPYFGVGSFRVRAINNPDITQFNDQSLTKQLGVSNLTSTISNSRSVGNNRDASTGLALVAFPDKFVFREPVVRWPEDDTKADDVKVDMGIFNYAFYGGVCECSPRHEENCESDTNAFNRRFIDAINAWWPTAGPVGGTPLTRNLRRAERAEILFGRDPAKPLPNENFTFVPQIDTMMMISSNYWTRAGYTAATTTLQANSWFVLSVWVYTTPGTLASITINNTSRVFARSTDYWLEGHHDPRYHGDYTGYIEIDTQGRWQQYHFFMQTSVTSASLQLELWLGNKYAVNQTVPLDNDTNVSLQKGFTRGTALFSSVAFRSISEQEYNMFVFGEENPEYFEIDDERGHNQGLNRFPDAFPATQNNFNEQKALENGFATLRVFDEKFGLTNLFTFQLLDYTTDAFDEFTENTTPDTPQGHTPRDYTHYVAMPHGSGFVYSTLNFV
jgi:hypothetical protein